LILSLGAVHFVYSGTYSHTHTLQVAHKGFATAVIGDGRSYKSPRSILHPCLASTRGWEGLLCYPVTAYPILRLQARLTLFVSPRRVTALSLIATTDVSAETPILNVRSAPASPAAAVSVLPEIFDPKTLWPSRLVAFTRFREGPRMQFLKRAVIDCLTNNGELRFPRHWYCRDRLCVAGCWLLAHSKLLRVSVAIGA
jgi:hypothetical protein